MKMITILILFYIISGFSSINGNDRGGGGWPDGLEQAASNNENKILIWNKLKDLIEIASGFYEFYHYSNVPFSSSKIENFLPEDFIEVFSPIIASDAISKKRVVFERNLKNSLGESVLFYSIPKTAKEESRIIIDPEKFMKIYLTNPEIPIHPLKDIVILIHEALVLAKIETDADDYKYSYPILQFLKSINGNNFARMFVNPRSECVRDFTNFIDKIDDFIYWNNEYLPSSTIVKCAKLEKMTVSVRMYLCKKRDVEIFKNDLLSKQIRCR